MHSSSPSFSSTSTNAMEFELFFCVPLSEKRKGVITFRFASLGKGRVDTFGRCYSPKFHSKYAGNMVISSFEDRGEGGGGRG